MVKNAKWWSTYNLPLYLTAIFYPFLKGFNKLKSVGCKIILSPQHCCGYLLLYVYSATKTVIERGFEATPTLYLKGWAMLQALTMLSVVTSRMMQLYPKYHV